jgi:NADH dehydrogenase
VLVEAGDRILGQLPRRLADNVVDRLGRRGVDVRTATNEVRHADGGVELSGAARLDTDTVVWTAGVVAVPLLRRLGLDVDRLGRARTDEFLRVADGVWAIGDCAAAPDLHGGSICPPTAQHAVRQAGRVAANVVATLRGRQPHRYRHRDAGAVASLGLGKGVAELYGVPLRGYAAWLVHRIYHGSRLPCRRRRLLVVLNWLLGSLARDPVALPALESPRSPLREAHAEQQGA